jgi:hypothetical protein
MKQFLEIDAAGMLKSGTQSANVFILQLVVVYCG